MKLQIISKLSNHNHYEIDCFPSLKLETRDSKPTSNRKLLAEDLDQYISTKIQKNHQRDPHNNSVRYFFDNFDTQCLVHYKKVPSRETAHRRKLQNQLLLMAEKCRPSPQNQSISVFTFSSKELRKTPQDYEPMITQPTRNPQDYYIAHQKPKPKIRKFNSLISIKQNDGTQELQRKPGFILKRNVSLGTKQSRSLYGNRKIDEHKTQESLVVENRENGGSRQKWDRFDEQISQSKQRIARIRRQLNQIYQTSRGGNSYKLRLF